MRSNRAGVNLAFPGRGAGVVVALASCVGGCASSTRPNDAANDARVDSVAIIDALDARDIGDARAVDTIDASDVASDRVPLDAPRDGVDASDAANDVARMDAGPDAAVDAMDATAIDSSDASIDVATTDADIDAAIDTIDMVDTMDAGFDATLETIDAMDVSESEAGRDVVDALDATDAPPDVTLPDGCRPRTCEAYGFTCGTLHDGCGGTVSCGGPCAVTSVPSDVRHIVYDAVYGRLYVGTGALDPIDPNAFLVTDPETGLAWERFARGAPVDSMTMGTRDTIYGAFFGSGVPLFYGYYVPWGDSSWDQMWPRDYTQPHLDDTRSRAIAVESVGYVVAQASPADGSAGCTALLLTSYLRTVVATAALDACPASFAMEPSGVVYGIASGPSGPELQVIQPTATSISVSAMPFATPLAHDTNATIALGRLYSTAGPVYEISSPTAPSAVGTLPFAGGVAVDSTSHIAMVFGNDTVAGSNALVWRAYDADTFELLLDDPGSALPVGPDGFVAEMISTGPNRFAAVVYPNGVNSPAQLFILHVPLEAAASAGDAGADASDASTIADVGPCWQPDAGPYDPNDPTAEVQNRLQYLAQQVVANMTASDAASGQSFQWAGMTPWPVSSSCAADPAGTWDVAPWPMLAFGFGSTEPHRYSYSVDATCCGTSAMFTARALGDLDGDGTYSTFEIAGGVLPDGGVIMAPLYASRPLE